MTPWPFALVLAALDAFFTVALHPRPDGRHAGAAELAAAFGRALSQ